MRNTQIRSLALMFLGLAGVAWNGCGSSDNSQQPAATPYSSPSPSATPSPSPSATPSASASATPAASPSPSPSSSASPTPGSVVVTTRTGSQGEFLVDGSGKSLYLFKADTAGKSTCNGACAAAWPPLLVPAGQSATAQGNAQSSLMGTTTRDDGTTQVTYKNNPLYYYAGDTATGDTNGEGLNQFGALWFLVAPDGSQL